MVKCNKKSEDFRLRKRLPDESFPIMTNDKCKINFKLNKKHLLQNVRSLLLRVNNLNIEKEDVICEIPGETRKSFWISIN